MPASVPPRRIRLVDVAPGSLLVPPRTQAETLNDQHTPNRMDP